MYYGSNNSTTDQSIINANLESLVDNSPAGPWGGNANISKFMSAGIKYFEYIDGGYEEQKAKLADDWIIRHMNNDRFKELKESLDKKETRIRALKAKIDPAQIIELESIRGILRFWESRIREMEVWNTENEDGSMFRQEEYSHKVALKMVGFGDKVISDMWRFAATKRDMLNKLQMRLVVFYARIEVNGLFPIEPINIQSCTSTGLR